MPENFKKWEVSLIATGTGLTFAIVVPIILFAGMGRWLDKIFETGILFSAAGGLIGISIAIVLVVRRISALMREAEEQRKKDITKE